MFVFVASLVMLQGVSGPVLCPVMGGPVVKGAEASDFAGVRYSYCCAGCREAFEKEPATYLSAAVKEGKVIGVSLFDPVSRRRIDAGKAKGGSSDFEGVRYAFDSADGKKAFDADPKRFGGAPALDSLICPVDKGSVKEYAKAGGYVDLEGVRYYFCSAGCEAKYAADPKRFSSDLPKAGAPRSFTQKAAPVGQAMSFSCKHCGRTMKVGSAADLDRTCTVCPCSKTAGECKPGK
jgi:YHS domain-containing protein